MCNFGKLRENSEDGIELITAIDRAEIECRPLNRNESFGPRRHSRMRFVSVHDLTRTRFVSGHGFSRAVKLASNSALAAEALPDWRGRYVWGGAQCPTKEDYRKAKRNRLKTTVSKTCDPRPATSGRVEAQLQRLATYCVASLAQPRAMALNLACCAVARLKVRTRRNALELLARD